MKLKHYLTWKDESIHYKLWNLWLETEINVKKRNYYPRTPCHALRDCTTKSESSFAPPRASGREVRSEKLTLQSQSCPSNRRMISLGVLTFILPYFLLMRYRRRPGYSHPHASHTQITPLHRCDDSTVRDALD